jgi:hypothetical protein
MPARIVFLLAALCSVGYFAWVVARRLGPLRVARANLRFDGIGSRLGRVFREVMLQTRVLRQRPIPGLLHALVMWGFFVFAWVSAEHLALGVIGFEPGRCWSGSLGWLSAGSCCGRRRWAPSFPAARRWWRC